MPKKASLRSNKRTRRAAASTTPNSVNDRDSIQQKATTAKLRRAALAWCLANSWAGEDVGEIERIEKDGWTGWGMMLRS